MINTMIEKVARAIELAPVADWRRNKANDRDNEYEVYIDRPTGVVDPVVIASFSNEKSARNMAYDFTLRSKARAAIEAMREPSDAMIISQGIDWPVARSQLQAAIDAALREGGQ